MEKVAISAKQEGVDQQIRGFLYQLELILEKLMAEVVKSNALYDVGTKTTLVKNIETTLKQNKVETLYGISENIDKQVVSCIDNILVRFFKTRISNISSVYKLKTPSKLDLYYLIVLKVDTIDNRQDIFSFLDEYDLETFANKYPVIFKFTKEDLLPGFFIEKKIEL